MAKAAAQPAETHAAPPPPPPVVPTDRPGVSVELPADTVAGASGERKAKSEEEDFFEMISAFTAADWQRHKAYLYRFEPLTDRLAAGKPAKYVTKYRSAFDQETVKLDHGSGVYQVRLNRQREIGTGDRTVRTHDFEIRDLKYPPKVASSEWMNDPRNADWAWGKGSEAPAGPSNGQGQSAGDFLKAVREAILLLRPGDQQASQESTVKAVIDAMKQSHAEAFQMFQQQSSASDPTKLLDVVAGILEKIMPKPAAAGSDPLLQHMLQSMREERNHMLEELREERKANREMMQRLLDAKPPSMTGHVREMVETIGLVQEMAGGAKDWKSVVADGVIRITDTIAPGIERYLEDRGRPAGAPQAAPPAEARERRPNAAAAAREPDTRETEKKQLFNYYRHLVAQIAPAFMNYLRNGRPGGEFADWFVAGYGLDEFWKIQQAGVENILVLARSIPELWSQLEPIEAKVRTFLEEFMRWNPEEVHAEPEPAEAAPAKPPGKANGGARAKK